MAAHLRYSLLCTKSMIKPTLAHALDYTVYLPICVDILLFKWNMISIISQVCKYIE